MIYDKVFLFLSGPSGVGVNELRRRLIEINPKIFQGAVPRTCFNTSNTNVHKNKYQKYSIQYFILFFQTLQEHPENTRSPAENIISSAEKSSTT